MNPVDFWTHVDATLDRIETEKPTTAEEVIKILHTGPDAEVGGPITQDHGFFAGSGGDRQLISALHTCGWRQTWVDFGFFYVATQVVTGSQLTYIEGDVYAGDVANRD